MMGQIVRLAKAGAANSLEHCILMKRDEDQFVFGPVLVADKRDGQGHIYTGREVELAAWRFASNGFKQNFMHKLVLNKNQVLVTESFVWRPDLFGPLKIGKRTYPAEVWLMGSLLNDALWKMYKDGKVGAYSIEGDSLAKPG